MEYCIYYHVFHDDRETINLHIVPHSHKEFVCFFFFFSSLFKLLIQPTLGKIGGGLCSNLSICDVKSLYSYKISKLLLQTTVNKLIIIVSEYGRSPSSNSESGTP